MRVINARRYPPLLPCQVFDLVCGSSSGGLVAILLGRFGLDCATAREVYNSLESSVTQSGAWNKLVKPSDFGLNSYENAIKQFLSGMGDVQLPMIAHVELPMSTKTFATVGVFARDYTDRVCHIRSYPTPKRASAPSPPRHQWSVLQAMRGTCAGRYTQTQPLYIEQDGTEYEFQDAAMLGFNNPTQLACREAEKLWSDTTVVVSLGTGLSDITGQRPTIIAETMLSNIPLSAADEKVSQRTAKDIVEQLIMTAADSELVHARTRGSIGPRKYHRINPLISLPVEDLVDWRRTTDTETAIQKWLDASEQAPIFEALVTDLKLQAKTKEEARFVPPPPPPPGTNKDYNPELDKPRPDNMIDYLKSYRVWFIIDDSGSMDFEGRWEETHAALIGIAEYAMKCRGLTDIDLRFFNSATTLLNIQSTSEIESVFTSVWPNGGTPTGAVLNGILNDHIRKLDQAIDTPNYRNIKPLDIIVITDGIPSDKPANVIAAASAHLQTSRHHPNHVGIQFVQIGRDKGADAALAQLMQGAVDNMVDTVLYDEKLTPQRLERILLGGIYPNVRAMLPSA
ncbi:hypothetical protein HWV62_771 [Athelia sp. TMB]|nr:hypothetical protein HWV62_771 [Athelia sp. TMB]